MLRPAAKRPPACIVYVPFLLLTMTLAAFIRTATRTHSPRRRNTTTSRQTSRRLHRLLLLLPTMSLAVFMRTTIRTQSRLCTNTTSPRSSFRLSHLLRPNLLSLVSSHRSRDSTSSGRRSCGSPGVLKISGTRLNRIHRFFSLLMDLG